jgi:Rrf2 family protein
MRSIDYEEMLVIAAVTDIALNGHSRVINARELEIRHRVPKRHLEPVLQTLVREGILKAQRGPRGGYKLAREPDRITSEDILRALRGSAAPKPPARSKLLDAVVRPAIAHAEREFLDHLSRITIKDLAAAAKRKQMAPDRE